MSHWWLEDRIQELRTNPIATLGAQILDKISYFHSGAVVEGVSHLRTFLYWRISDHMNVPFLPSCRRAPQFEAIYRQLRRSVPKELYRIVANAFGASVREAQLDAEPVPLQLPPVLTLFLERTRRGSVAIDVLQDLRSEFAPLRKAMAQLQEELSNAATIKERLDAKHRLKTILSSLGQHYQVRNESVLDEMIAFAPHVLKPLANPMDPSKYGADLVLKPKHWVKNWWVRRPFRLAYRLRDTLQNISRYESLLADSLGVSIAPVDAKQFHAHYDHYLAMYTDK